MDDIDLKNWDIDVEDGVRLARFSIDCMCKENNPLMVVHALRPYLDQIPPQMVGFMDHLAIEILNLRAAAKIAERSKSEDPQPSPQATPVLRLVR